MRIMAGKKKCVWYKVYDIYTDNRLKYYKVDTYKQYNFNDGSGCEWKESNNFLLDKKDYKDYIEFKELFLKYLGEEKYMVEDEDYFEKDNGDYIYILKIIEK